MDNTNAVLPNAIKIASAKTSEHNFVFLEGVKAALCADPDWNNGDYTSPPVRGLKAFGRVIKWNLYFYQRSKKIKLIKKMNLTDKQKGIFLSLFGVLIITPDSLFIRLINIPSWDLLFYRGLIPSFCLFIFLLLVQDLKAHQMQTILQQCEHTLQLLHHENPIELQAIHLDAIPKKLLKSKQQILKQLLKIQMHLF